MVVSLLVYREDSGGGSPHKSSGSPILNRLLQQTRLHRAAPLQAILHHQHASQGCLDGRQAHPTTIGLTPEDKTSRSTTTEPMSGPHDRHAKYVGIAFLPSRSPSLTDDCDTDCWAAGGAAGGCQGLEKALRDCMDAPVRFHSPLAAHGHNFANQFSPLCRKPLRNQSPLSTTILLDCIPRLRDRGNDLALSGDSIKRVSPDYYQQRSSTLG